MSPTLLIVLLSCGTPSAPPEPSQTAGDVATGTSGGPDSAPSTDTVDPTGDTGGWCDSAPLSTTGAAETGLPPESSEPADTTAPVDSTVVIDTAAPGDSSPPVDTMQPVDPTVVDTTAAEVTAAVDTAPAVDSVVPTDSTPIVDTGVSLDTALYPQVGCGSLDRLYQYGGFADERAWMMTGTPDGGFVLVGELYSVIVFGAGEPNETTISSLAGDDAFIAKYAADGSIEWAQHISDFNNVRAKAVAVGTDGTIAVTGGMSSEATVAPAAEAIIVPYRGGGVDADVFVAVFEPDGTPRWAHSVGGTGYDDYGGVAVGNDGAVYVAGSYEDPGVEVGPVGSGVFLDNTTADLHTFLVRFETDGAIGWTRIISGDADEVPVGLSVLPNGNVLIAGQLTETITFSEGEVDEVIHDAGNGLFTLNYLASYAPDGSLAWWRTPGSLDYGDFPEGTLTASSGGWMYGLAGNEAVFGAGEPNEFVFPVDAHTYVSSFYEDGTLEWVRLVHKTAGTSSNAVLGAYRAASGRYAVAGYLNGDWSFTDENGTVLSGHAGWSSTDPFAAAYNADGELECLFIIPSDTSYYIEEARPVYIDDLGGLWVAAMFIDEIQIAPGTPEETILTGTGGNTGSDIVLARFILPGGYPLP